MATVFCTQCGAMNDDAGQYCNKCGASLDQTNAVDYGVTSATYVQPTAQMASNQPQIAQQPYSMGQAPQAGQAEGTYDPTDFD